MEKEKLEVPPKPVLLEDLGMKEYGNQGQKKRIGLFKCSCGKEFVSVISSVTCGRTKSCGCFLDRSRTHTKKTHGLRKHKLYKINKDIISRCYNKNEPAYKNYGGRGISVCDEWRNDVVSFFYWCMENGWKPGLQIDRINNDGNYEPSNCRFVTPKENSNNRRPRINPTGYTGVAYRGGRFRSHIHIGSKIVHLGSFDTAIDAALAYNQYIIDHNLPNKLGVI